MVIFVGKGRWGKPKMKRRGAVDFEKVSEIEACSFCVFALGRESLMVFNELSRYLILKPFQRYVPSTGIEDFPKRS